MFGFVKVNNKHDIFPLVTPEKNEKVWKALMVKFIAPTHHIECNKDEKIYLTFKGRNSFSTGKEAIPAGM